MQGLVRLAWLAAAVAGSGAVAGAAPPTPAPAAPLGSRIPVPVAGEEADAQRESSQILQSWARCVVGRNPQLFEAMVAIPELPGTNAARMALFARAHNVMDGCLFRAARMTANHWIMVGAFAEHLYRRRFDSLPPLVRVALPPETDPSDVALRTTLEFADCLIDRSAAGVDALSRASVGSGQERAAYAALAPFYTGCMDAGSSLTLSRTSLRAALADRIYRRALAAAAPAPTAPAH